ncbi:MAG: MBOAT family protein [Desulfovibrio sp.]|jgi:alginate O-acetyltransferase complex protein AlgI|nr:MBOAT family protein [Desulfovibrio sp.]
MLFNSYPFLFCFLPLLLLTWRFMSGGSGGSGAASRLSAVLLLFSAVFYALWGAAFTLLLAAVIAMNYAFGMAFAAPDNVFAQKHRIGRKKMFVLAMILNLLPLVWFKYSGFLAQNLALLFSANWEFATPGLPLGISFYTFIQIAWLSAVYQRRVTPEGIARHALFSSCFPYVISGPIVRYEQMKDQFDNFSTSTSEGLARGLSLFSLGLAKKVLLADSIAVYANSVFNAAEKGFPLSGLEAWLGSFCYTFQLYFDFSGYTDMALGLGLMIGLRLPENFDSPYKSTGIVDFWRRWHITLGSWLRDYLYIPLGGNRAGKLTQYRNLFLTMFIGGVWHGAGWTFAIWGALHGVMLAVNHYFRAAIKGKSLERVLKTLPCRLAFIIFTFLCVNACWVVFRAATFTGAARMYSTMAAGSAAPFPSEAGLLPNNYFQGWQPFALLLICSAIVWLLPNTREILKSGSADARTRLQWSASGLWAAGLAVLTFVTLILVSRKSTFLYFQF